jgi:hypothetical protein
VAPVFVRSRLRWALLALVVVAPCWVGVAVAGYKQPLPQAGAWKFGEAVGGFSLVKGKGKMSGKLFLTNVHSFTTNFVGCPEKPERITVSGRFPLKLLPLAGFPGYKAWGVGKTGTEKRYSDGSPGLVSIPAKVTVAGKPVEGGGIKMDFSSTEPKEFSMLIIEFGPPDESPCITYSLSAKHG